MRERSLHAGQPITDADAAIAAALADMRAKAPNLRDFALS